MLFFFMKSPKQIPNYELPLDKCRLANNFAHNPQMVQPQTTSTKIYVRLRNLELTLEEDMTHLRKSPERS